ncbi:MAG: NADH-quinone oxidoreductase subunit J, partial [Planctomycetota bacterium]|nr:NADH-quinone oxidoreductase subunit J [Planctomycetota bacterium]
VAFSRNIVHSAFALLVTFFGVAGIYVFLGADFLAIAQVVIYVGGILVLILFAVMLTSKITDVKLSNPQTSPYIAGPLVFLIFVGLVWLIMTTPWQVKGTLDIGGISAIGEALLGRYLLAFEVSAVLLLGALLGATYLARKSQ